MTDRSVTPVGRALLHRQRQRSVEDLLDAAGHLNGCAGPGPGQAPQCVLPKNERYFSAPPLLSISILVAVLTPLSDVYATTTLLPDVVARPAAPSRPPAISVASL
jgi:hypothetical protein